MPVPEPGPKFIPMNVTRSLYPKILQSVGETNQMVIYKNDVTN